MDRFFSPDEQNRSPEPRGLGEANQSRPRGQPAKGPEGEVSVTSPSSLRAPPRGPLDWELQMFPELVRDDVFRIETRRLWLRWPMAGDAGAIADFAADVTVAEMTSSIPHPYPDGEATRCIERWRSANAAGQALHLVLTAKDAHRRAMGCISLKPDPAGPTLGYMVAPTRSGQGFATEAAQAMVDTAFTLTGQAHLHAWARVVNPGSRRVLEKCGFRYETTALRHAPARGGMLPCDEFRLDRKTWRSLKQWRMPVLDARPAAAGADAPPFCLAPEC